MRSLDEFLCPTLFLCTLRDGRGARASDLVVALPFVPVAVIAVPAVAPVAALARRPVDPSGRVEACRCISERTGNAEPWICWGLSRSGDREHHRHCHRAESNRR